MKANQSLKDDIYSDSSSTDYIEVESQCNSGDGDPIENAVKPPFYKLTAFWVSTATMLAAGTANPLINKKTYSLMSYPCPPWDVCEQEVFEGFIILTALKYIYHALLAAFLYYVIDYTMLFKRGHEPRFSSRKEIEGTATFDWRCALSILVPCVIDVTFSILNRWATLFTLSSTIAVMGLLQIISALCADMVISMRRIAIGNVIGIVFIVGGILVYGLGMMSLESDDDPMNSNPLLGASLSGLGAICRGLHSVLQGRNMKKYRMPAFKMVLIEALFGLCILPFYIMVFQMAEYQNIIKEFWMCYRNWKLSVLVNVYAAQCFFFNGGAAVVGKIVSGLFRMILSRIPGVLMWLCEMALGWTLFSYVTLIGWIVLIFGVLIYGGGYRWFEKQAPWVHKTFGCCKCLLRNRKMKSDQFDV
eukprot:GHVH01009986.1.p1 GENE.GHVH01009986.1~~GHVH01009986.1.p1  ORF type:complete len:417 (-),score=40.90 GHVH01009986.1:208-1458(-)